MNSTKKYLLLLVLMACLTTGFSQGNPAVTSVGFERSPISKGDTTILTVVISNATFSTGAIPVGNIQLTVSLPSNEVYTLSDGNDPAGYGNTTTPSTLQISDNQGNVYDWIGDGEGGYRGTNNTIIPQGGQTIIEFLIYGNKLSDGTLTVVNVQGLNGTATSNMSGDDNGSAELGVDQALPIKLVNFTASIFKNVVELDWETTSEWNNSHYEIERSLDGRTFSSIGKVLGSGSTNKNNEYSFTDTKPGQGKNYYRLKQVDYDGSVDYSTTRMVNFVVDSPLILFPNPVIAGSEINIQGPRIHSVEVFNMFGQLVKEKVFDQSQNIVRIPSNNLDSGIYTVRVNGFSEERIVIN